MKPPVGDKFVAYGGPNLSVDTELKCRFIGPWGEVLLVAPDPNYYHLLIEGNRRHPVPGENGYSAGEDGYGFEPLILANLPPGEPPPPILKLECEAVGSRPDSNDGPPNLPLVNDNGHWRPLKVGDCIRVSGLYVIDYGHTMWCNRHSDPTFARKVVVTVPLPPPPHPYECKVGIAHAELHPYNYGAVELLTNMQPSAELFTEVHTIVAPIYPEVFGYTYLANRLLGVAGHLFEETKQETQTATFFIQAPPKPDGYYEPHLEQSEVVKMGQGTVRVSYTKEEQGFRVTVSVIGTDVRDPLIYRAKYAVKWVPFTPEPKISFSDTHINFGAIPAKDVKMRTLRIRNVGTADLIVSIEASLPRPAPYGRAFTWVGVNDAVIHPGESKDVRISFMPRGEGDYDDTMEIKSNVPSDGLHQIGLSGRGIGGVQPQ